MEFVFGSEAIYYKLVDSHYCMMQESWQRLLTETELIMVFCLRNGIEVSLERTVKLVVVCIKKLCVHAVVINTIKQFIHCPVYRAFFLY